MILISAEAKRQTKAICVELQEKQSECDAKENKIRCLTKDINEKSKGEQQVGSRVGLSHQNCYNEPPF